MFDIKNFLSMLGVKTKEEERFEAVSQAQAAKQEELKGYQAPIGPSTYELHGRPGRNPYGEMVYNEFGEEAGNAERVLRWGDPGMPGSDTQYGEEYGGENLSYDEKAVNENKDGTKDYGLYMINSATLEDEMKRNPEVVASLGITSTEDLLNPLKNIKFAKYLQQTYGWGRWYGRPDDL